jgi:hypothetical protein
VVMVHINFLVQPFVTLTHHYLVCFNGMDMLYCYELDWVRDYSSS